MHVCDYLLAVDMEMEPVPGYRAASWDKGYGDFAVRPDPSTMRRIPWLEGTALVLGDCVDHHGDDLPHAPRSMLKWQLARALDAGYRVKMGSELEFYLFDDSYEEVAEKRYTDLKTAGRYIEDYHIFQTTKEEGLIRAVRMMNVPVCRSNFTRANGAVRKRSIYATPKRLRWRIDTASTRTV